MRQELKLYIDEKEVQFSEPPEILYNYKETELKNPTIIKNSYSKTLTIQGTNSNNDLFGHIYDFSRLQEYNGSFAGVDFNPLKKANFSLYLNGEIYESGYIKLDEVRKTGENIEYDITLYGGLGEFFYNLSYKKNDEGEVEGPSKLTLADLSYSAERGWEPNLDYTINKETVNAAWDWAIGVPDDPESTEEERRERRKYQLINFAPCYNGLPDGFDANKYLINNNSEDYDYTFNNTTAQTKDYLVGESNEELTEWETRDLRSYLQRPIFRMREIINACCLPENNGGYNVDLDTHFFNPLNPYYEDAWVTLPMIKDLELQPQKSESHSVSVDGDSVLFELVPDGTFDYASYNNLSFTFRPYLDIVSGETDYNTTLYSAYSIQVEDPSFSFQKFVERMAFASSLNVQLFAVDDKENVVGVSNLYMLRSMPYMAKVVPAMITDLEKGFDNKNDKYRTPIPDITRLYGSWKNINNKWVFVDDSGHEIALKFKLNTNASFRKIYVKIKNAYRRKIVYNWGSKSRPSEDNNPTMVFYTTRYRNESHYIGRADAINTNSVEAKVNFDIEDFSVSIADEYEDIVSQTKITKKDYLTTDKTPCDYLLSYCKLFGLYLWKDPVENTIHIMDRNTFYKQDSVIDFDSIVDRGKEITITPQVAENKWYDFTLEEIESEVNEDYKATYDVDYGLKRINTGFDFNSEKKDVFDGNIFKSGVMAQEKSKYYNKLENNVPQYVKNGFKYAYMTKKADEETYSKTEFDIPVSTFTNIPINDMGIDKIDSFPKLQCHGKENDPVDGDMVLLFQDGLRDMGDVDYFITDDTEEMVMYNDGTPMWLMTNVEEDKQGRRIAIKRRYIPFFTRDLVNRSTGYITHSWDFGAPKETFVPKTYVSDGMSVYDRCWGNYIADMYNTNNRIISAYCLISERPNPDWLRRFYWFNNSIWRLNSISDWNISSYESTKCEFIKVLDRNSYMLDRITRDAKYEIIMETDHINAYANEVSGVVYVQDGSGWVFTDKILVDYSDGRQDFWDVSRYITPTRGMGGERFVFSIPENSEQASRTFTILLPDGLGEAQIIQDGNSPASYITVTPEELMYDWDDTNSKNINVTSNGGYSINIYDKTDND